MDHSICYMETRDRAVNVGEWYELEVLSYLMMSACLVRSNPAVPLLDTELP